MKKLGILMLTVLVGTIGCSRNEHGKMKELPSVRTRLATVEAISSPHLIRVPGMVSSSREAYVSAKSMGTVLAIHVKAGDHVKKGQPMLQIDSSDIRSKLQQAQGAKAQAEAALAIAEANYKRFQELYQRNAASKVELEQMAFQYNTAKGAVKMAEGAVHEAESYLKYASVTAPFDAIVVERMINVGDFAAPGRPLFRLIDPMDMEFVCQVSESDARFVHVGDPVRIVLDNRTEPLTGSVSEVAAGSDFMTHTVLTRVKLDELNGVRAGMYGQAVFNGTERTTVRIPESWVVRRGELEMVFVKGHDGRAEMRIVRTGKRLDGQVEIISGLSGGEQVATTNLTKLGDGVKLEAI